MIKLDPYDIGLIGNLLFIAHPTGVSYEVQAGGMGCEHPSCEGFLLTLDESLFGDFDDCSYGCDHINGGGNETRTEQLQQDIDTLLESTTRSWSYILRFDFDRRKELREGWWPVTMKGKYQGQSVDWKGYIHTGNCD